MTTTPQLDENLRILVCTNKRLGHNTPSCDGEALAQQLEILLRARGMAVPVERTVCFGHCEKGPNIRLAPGGRFFHGVTPDELPSIIEIVHQDTVRRQ